MTIEGVTRHLSLTYSAVIIHVRQIPFVVLCETVAINVPVGFFGALPVRCLQDPSHGNKGECTGVCPKIAAARGMNAVRDVVASHRQVDSHLRSKVGSRWNTLLARLVMDTCGYH